MSRSCVKGPVFSRRDAVARSQDRGDGNGQRSVRVKGHQAGSEVSTSPADRDTISGDSYLPSGAVIDADETRHSAAKLVTSAMHGIVIKVCNTPM